MKFLSLMIALTLALPAIAKDWPIRIFAPYMYIGAGDHFQLTQCDNDCGQKFYTIAFIIADKDGNPAWDGRFSTENNFYLKQIEAIRHRGGDVIISFGGADGTEIALAETNNTRLETKYQTIIDRYRCTWLDFDIEGDSLEKTAANERRNEVLATLQKRNRNLRITFTLPVDPHGISDNAQKMLSDATSRGVNIFSVNIMTMDFGEVFSKGKKLSDISIASALKAHQQCQSINPKINIGITAMIGQNDVHSEVLSPDDAKTLVVWSKQQPWIVSVSFWASNRDAGNAAEGKNENLNSGVTQAPWEFTKIFQTFTAP